MRRARIVLFFLSQDFDKKKNRMFCWTELGAKHIGIMQSLLVTCRLHGIDPYDYLVDVLQRVWKHPLTVSTNLRRDIGRRSSLTIRFGSPCIGCTRRQVCCSVSGYKLRPSPGGLSP